mmetsp:Transcript_31695/g.77776  ORF Transcript_31695/g.77776 Transcript_31695/m.77776 type:complete len:299 (+) Transcript_31695:38-934(+)
MLSYTQRPHLTACTIEAKLSSITMMSAACCATCVPVFPIANPTSALLSAGASLVPSPVTATVCGVRIRDCCIPETRVSLSMGDERASTRSVGQILSNWSIMISSPTPITCPLNVSPVMTSSSFTLEMMPHFNAIDAAVLASSPVIMRTVIPADLHTLIASGTSGRMWSSMPMREMKVSLFSRPRSLGVCEIGGSSSKSRNATTRVRSPCDAKLAMWLSISRWVSVVKADTDPSGLRMESHLDTTKSAAPFVNMRNTFFCCLRTSVTQGTTVLIIFRSEEKGMDDRSGWSIGKLKRMDM